jgi:CubicO group peptidase (beta-lactamase class C family)
MTGRHAVAALAAAVLTANVTAQSDRTDDFIRGQMNQQGIPGLSVAVVKNGAIVKQAGYGYADIAKKITATPDTVYKIASVSKSVLATGVMTLVQDGKIGLHDPVGKYLDGAPSSWAGITVRHLLSHTSGLIREAPAFDPVKVQSDAEVIKSAYGTPLRFAPGERYEYGNLNYFALAEIIREVSGRPWSEYIDAKVLKPAGMNATFPTNTKARVGHRAVGYVDNDNPRPAPHWVALRPSGAFLSTVLDLARWDAALDADRIVSVATRRDMWTRVKLRDGTDAPYGLGWFVSSANGRTRVQHTGGMPGARAGFVKYLEDRLTIIVLMNLDDVDIDAIVGGLAALYLS